MIHSAPRANSTKRAAMSAKRGSPARSSRVIPWTSVAPGSMSRSGSILTCRSRPVTRRSTISTAASSMIRWSWRQSSPVVSVSRVIWRIGELQGRGAMLLPEFLNRRLDLRDRPLDFVLGEIACGAAAVAERHRVLEAGAEFAGPELVGDRAGLVGEALGAPAHDDRRNVVAVGSAALFGFAHDTRPDVEDRR